MALTAALSAVTPDRLIYLLTQDGGAGATLDLTCGTGPVPPDPAADALDWTDLARVLALTGLSTAKAKGIAQGIGVGVDATVDPTHYCTAYIVPVTGTATWLLTSVDAAGRVRWSITAPAGASTALLVINYSLPVGPV